MAQKSKYKFRSRISEKQFRMLVKLFSADLMATQIAYLTGLNRNTVNRYLQGIREHIAAYCEEQFPFSGTVEVDESWFGARRVKGKRGRGAYGKTTVFGIYERNGHVYTEIVPDCSKSTLQAIIRGKVAAESVVNSDGWRGYNGLVDIGYGHFRVDHGKDEFARGHTHVNGIEGFWGIAKVRLAKFRGMAKSTFYLHLKETEFRYNHRNDNIYKILLSLLRNNPLK
ncbi:MAG: IS1595 family transposase [Pseudomonadota bacterium]|nr:IS1595 family transposase [Pseudomonadota bacterium]MDE3038435.1 IS1595 family transposase [Pseudomonadota bacterium]